VDSWLIWHLTSGSRHVTDVTNASRTLLFNIVKGEWDPELLRLFNIPASMLPKVVWSSELVGEVTTTLGLGRRGHRGHCRRPAGCAVWATVLGRGRGQKHLRDRLLPAAEHRHGVCALEAPAHHHAGSQHAQRLEYAFEGSIFIGGAVVQWLRDNLKLIGSSGDVEALAASVSDNGGVVLVPAFVGPGRAALGCACGRPADRVAPRHQSRATLRRAALESIAFQVADVLEAVQSETTPLAALRADGGAAVNNLLMQFQADVLGVPVVRPRVTETTALGAAYLAGLATGFWANPEELRVGRRGDVHFEPKMDAAERARRRSRWQRAVERAKGWSE
jgi:glycerol kinase